METLIPLAAKSFVVAGATFLLLKLMARRSAADRSLIAHLGLVALLLLPLAALALPSLEVAGPSFLAAPAQPPVVDVAAAPEVAAPAATFPGSADPVVAAPVDWALWAYAAPAVMLVLLTLIAVTRLAILKSKANVLVDSHWLNALAEAQRRMGLKNGTALLTSDELGSPISWGVMRPVILLNSGAVEARADAEAIIAHELAHVSRLDWAKLLLARLVVALCWFNPLVWLLSREAHQLREEAADDAVLASNVDDTDYANLLVGIARHECRGLLIGAHGVAPGRNSLARRVRRVLDAASTRAPGGWRWSSAAAFFAAGMTVPVAALQFVTPTIATAAEQGHFVQTPTPVTAPRTPLAVVAPPAPAAAARTLPTPLPSLTPPAPVRPVAVPSPVATPAPVPLVAAIAPGSVEQVVAAAIAQAVRPTLAARSAVERSAALRAVGASPAYVAAIRSAAPQLRIEQGDVLQFAAVGVTPAYLHELMAAGGRQLTAGQVVAARAMGLDGAYIRGLAAAGYGDLSMSSLSQLRALGITPGEVARYRRSGQRLPSVHELVRIKALGLDPDDFDPDADR